MTDREFVDSAGRLIAEEAENRKQMEKYLGQIRVVSIIASIVLLLISALGLFEGMFSADRFLFFVAGFCGITAAAFGFLATAIKGLSPYLSTQSKMASAMLSLAMRRETDKAES